MKFKKIIMIAGALAGTYLVGKLVGAKFGAEAVLNKYSELIPDDTFTVTLVDNKAYSVTTIAKKCV